MMANPATKDTYVNSFHKFIKKYIKKNLFMTTAFIAGTLLSLKKNLYI